LAGPFELEVGCKNKSACEVPKEKEEVINDPIKE
jgi:hypothetical protein